MKHSHKQDKNEIEQARHIATHVARVSRDVQLSKRQKKAMLRNILPSTPLYLRFGPMLSAGACALLVVGVLVIQGSRPGDALYGIKRGIEDARSSVQHSYDQQLIKRRDAEIKQIEDSGGSEQKMQIANQEKQKIEERVKVRSGDSAEEHESDSNHNTQDASSEKSSNTNVESNKTSAKDACEAALDARKKAGETISSDDYKACDKLD